MANKPRSKKQQLMESMITPDLGRNVTDIGDHERFELETVRVSDVEPDPDNVRHFGYRPPTLEEIELGSEQIKTAIDDTGLAQHLADQIEAVRSLAESLKAQKQIQPITAYRDGAIYRIIAGESRWLAHQLAGIDTIDAKIYFEKPVNVYARQYAENAHRESMSLLAETEALRRVLNVEQDDLAGIGMNALMEHANLHRSKAKRWAAILRYPEVVSAIYRKSIKLRSTAERIGRESDEKARHQIIEQVRKDGDAFSNEPTGILESATTSRRSKPVEKPKPGPAKTTVMLGRVKPGVAIKLVEALAQHCGVGVSEDATPAELEEVWKKCVAALEKKVAEET